MYENIFDLIGLLDIDAYPHAVDAWLDKHPLVLIACDGQGRKQDFRGGSGFDFGYVMALS